MKRNGQRLKAIRRTLVQGAIEGAIVGAVAGTVLFMLLFLFEGDVLGIGRLVQAGRMGVLSIAPMVAISGAIAGALFGAASGKEFNETD